MSNAFGGPWALWKHFWAFRSRQKLLLMAIIALVLAAMALTLVQTTMGGLQRNLISRSQQAEGVALISFEQYVPLSLVSKIPEISTPFYFGHELSFEGLIKFQGQVKPLQILGLGTNHPYTGKLGFRHKHKEIILGQDLAYRLGSFSGVSLKLISPGHIDVLLEEIPRSLIVKAQGAHQTLVPELDAFTGWTSIKTTQSLARSLSFNTLRIFSSTRPMAKSVTTEAIREWIDSWPDELMAYRPKALSWHKRHETLLSSLALEENVMAGLFSLSSLLVGMSLIAGLSLLFRSFRPVFSAYWILGISKKGLESMLWPFVFFMAVIPPLIGVGLGLGLAMGLKFFGPEVLPDIFIDRKLPMDFVASKIFMAWLIPAVMALVFSFFAHRHFISDGNGLDELKNS